MAEAARGVTLIPYSPGPGGPPPFTVETVRSDSGTVICASGELDIATVDALQAALDDGARLGDPIELDMTEVTFIDSSGLRTLIVAHESASAEDREFAVVPSKAVRKLLDLAGLAQFIPLRSEGDADGSCAA